MMAWTMFGLVPNVGGISAASTTPSRPLVPAPTKMIRPPLRSACVMISTPCAMRSFSRWTAATTLRSSLTIRSMMSGTAALSIARLAGLMASVGSACHFECVVSMNDSVYGTAPDRVATGSRVQYSSGARGVKRA